MQEELLDQSTFDDPKACREQAAKCRQEADQAVSPNLKDDLLELARLWDRMAADLENAQCLEEMRRILTQLGGSATGRSLRQSQG